MLQQQYTQPQQVVRAPEQITYEMRLNYFKDQPEPPKAKFYVFAAVLLLTMFLFHNLYCTLFCIACFVPIVLRFIKWIRELNRPTMTDQEYDRWTWSHHRWIQEEALQKFRIARDASEVQSDLKTIRGFVVPRDADADFYRTLFYAKQGADGKFRSSVSRFFVLYLAEHELCLYIRDVNALDDKCIKKDSTHYYEMIASVSMDAYGFYVGDGQDEKLVSLDYFAVTMTSGHKIGMTTVSRDDATEQTVAELRQLLGAKKYGQASRAAGGFPGYGGMSDSYSPSPQYMPTTDPYAGYAGVPGGSSPLPQYPPTTGPGNGGYPPPPPITGPYPGSVSPPYSAPTTPPGPPDPNPPYGTPFFP